MFAYRIGMKIIIPYFVLTSVVRLEGKESSGPGKGKGKGKAKRG